MDICQPLLLLLCLPAFSQTFTQRGFLDTTAVVYPQTAPNDSAHITGSAFLNYEATLHLNSSWTINGGIEARADTHHETERVFGLSWWDRGSLRPAFAVRRLNLTYSRGKLTVVAGKQLIRWGKADILNPTDRFAARDFLNVVNTEFLGVTAARLTYGTASDTIDLVASPRFTPSRLPLWNQRWSGLPPQVSVIELQPELPGGPQFGARWNHVGSLAEYSLSFYNGFDHLPQLGVTLVVPLVLAHPLVIAQRYYSKLRMYGGDAAIPLGPVSVKTEAAYFTSSSPLADSYFLGVLQLERQVGECSFVAGYATQAITRHGSLPSFSPDRGFTRAVLAHAGYTIDVNRSLSLESVIRQNGGGLWFKAEYSQAFGQHWRATTGFAWLHGAPSDFLGQFHRNSYGILTFRYSF